MTVLDKNETIELPERLPAALFVPDGGPSLLDFLEFSETFYMNHQDLLLEDVGAVSPGGQPADNPCNSIVFDARTRRSETYVWQLNRADHNSRVIEQLKSTFWSLSGVRFEMNCQGILVSSEELIGSGLATVFDNLRLNMESPATKRHIERITRSRAKALEDMEDFKKHGIKHLEITLKGSDGEDVRKVSEVKLEGAAYTKELEKRRVLTHEIGFTAVKPYEPTKLAA